MRIGLTGGIGSGKSAVAELLAGHGAVIIDADLLAREAVAPGSPGLAAVVDAFGPGVLAPDGGLDRPSLGRLVFADADARAQLNGIVHPQVRRLAAEREAALSPSAVAVHVIPLLVETGQQGSFDLVVVVDVDEATQLRRIVTRDGLPESEARARIQAQASRAERLASADAVIDNNGPWNRLVPQVARLWRRVRGSA
ncbi:MAG: dephospho-CoA kinase [Propionicimonas sp.]|uniref:dephospho-CoA kinase n=1 Tax=Propionicimonas sp. TaxID=1955623 RepID=UPI002B1F6DAE|nr:dephospho-CoA kinase [Propionicimonas sp.]MEA4942990.1 dephospho-CoA kinase [Propionicimonas sp.]